MPCEKPSLPRKPLRRPVFAPGELYQVRSLTSTAWWAALVLSVDSKGLVVTVLVDGRMGLWDVWSFSDALLEPPRAWVG